MEIDGFRRADGTAGIRNYLLILAATRGAHFIASKVADAVSGTRCFIPEDEDGKSSTDRLTLRRVLTGLGKNPNVGAVLVICNGREQGYPELKPVSITEEIAETGKPVELLCIDEEDGVYNSLGEGIKIARRLVSVISEQRRTKVGLGSLTLAVKCGLSDATSGIAGNPVVGEFFNSVVDAGGKVLFSETTEVIGAEHLLADRCRNDEVRRDLLRKIADVEEAAKATGEDIRSINPIPANIEAGISTLEEKSLGAISKAGTRTIEGVLKYGECPGSGGLYFMDSWMSSTSLFLGYAAAGAVLNIFQLGGMVLPNNPVLPSMATGIVAPIMYTTGNPRTFSRGMDEIDFNAGTVITDNENIESIAAQFGKKLCSIAGGSLVKTETLKYQDQAQVYFTGLNL